jgi:cell division protein FtsI/penicillin-binding protein 2
MYYQRRKRVGRVIVLAGLVGAGIAGIAAGDKSGPALKVGGQQETAPERAPASRKEVARRALSPDEALTSALRAPKLEGDAALRGLVDLGRMKLAGDRYEVPLGTGKSRAILTIDPVMQEEAHKLLVHARAPMSAIVVMKPNGEILALAGRKHGPPAEDRAHHLATTVWAPSASIFKLVTASALLQAGVKPDTKYCFHGGLRSVMASNLKDDPRRDNRCETLGVGVSESNNALVAKLAHRFLDPARLSKAARAFGYGQPARFALDTEASRITVPDDPLERARFAAGFWSSELSALDGAILTNVIATGGVRVTPRIVAEVVDASGVRRPVVAPKRERVLPRKVAEEVGKMMVRTIEAGTGAKAFRGRKPGTPLHGMRIAGKTGSLSQVKPRYLGFSWFVGYAPADKPEYVVSVLFGNPEAWYLKAHTASRLLLERSLGTWQRNAAEARKTAAAKKTAEKTAEATAK